jgi:hypothetical protein
VCGSTALRSGVEFGGDPVPVIALLLRGQVADCVRSLWRSCCGTCAASSKAAPRRIFQAGRIAGEDGVVLRVARSWPGLFAASVLSQLSLPKSSCAGS